MSFQKRKQCVCRSHGAPSSGKNEPRRAVCPTAGMVLADAAPRLTPEEGSTSLHPCLLGPLAWPTQGVVCVLRGEAYDPVAPQTA